MLGLVITINFILYNISMYRYSTFIFDRSRNITKIIVITSILNTAAFGLYYVFFPTNSESFLMFSFFVSYLIGFRVVNDRIVNLLPLYLALTQVINLFAKYIIFLSTIALTLNLTMWEVINTPTLAWVCINLAYLAEIIRAWMQKKVLRRDQLHLILSDRMNMIFSIGILSATAIYMLFILNFADVSNTDKNYVLMYLIIGIVCNLLYYINALYSYVFGKLKTYVTKYENISDDVRQEQEEVRTLEHVADHDAFTGFKVRTAIECEIQASIDKKEAFFLTFIDMDGLKNVNDKYGHAEGDFYILNVCDILRNSFSGDTIARLGGDEFLVYSLGDDIFIHNQRTMLAYQKIEKLGKSHNKEYTTSISYGIVPVTHNNTKTKEELIAEADAKMYKYKKSKKRERKTIAID